MAASSAFNVDQFLQTEVKGANDTTLIPIPPGEYKAQVFKLNGRRHTQEGEEPRVVLDVLWEILDESVKKHTGIEKPIAKQGLFLDILPNGAISLEKGKNVQLGQLREALGMNRKDRAFSFQMLKGAVATVQVTNRPDKDNANIVYSDVKKVTAFH